MQISINIPEETLLDKILSGIGVILMIPIAILYIPFVFIHSIFNGYIFDMETWEIIVFFVLFVFGVLLWSRII